MKFTVDAAALAATLKGVAAVLPAKPPNPAHALVLVQAGEDRTVTFCATDGRQRLVCRCVAEVATPGAACLPGAQLLAVASALGGAVTVASVDNDVSLADTGGENLLRVSSLTPEQFPAGDEGMATRCSFTLPGAVLANLLRVVASAMPKPEITLPGNLDGLCFDLDTSGEAADLGLVTSDNKRIAVGRTVPQDVVVRAVPGPGVAEAPSRFVATMAGEAVDTAAALARGCETVSLVFSSGLGTLRGELFAFTFPLTVYERKVAWRGGLPGADGAGSASVEVAALAEAVSRALACVRDGLDSQAVTIECQPGAGLKLSARGSEGRSEVRCPVMSSPDGADTESKTVIVSGRLLLQHLRALGKGPLDLNFHGAGQKSAGSALGLKRDNVFITLAGMSGEAPS